MSVPYNMFGVEREALADILHTEIERRGGTSQVIGRGDGAASASIYAASLADEIAASGQMTADTARRRLTAILNGGWYTTRSGRRLQQHLVNFDVADKILTALHMNELWYTNPELAAAVVEPPKKQPAHLAAIRDQKRPVKPCKGCGGDWDVFRSDCRTCQSRRCYRAKRARDKSAALVQSLDGPRHGSSELAVSPLAAAPLTSIERKAA